jgi:integrase
MARKLERLTALTARRAEKPGYYPDGGGLYLHVTKSKSKSWAFRFMLAGRAREMGLGPYPDVELYEARGKALEARKLRREGFDPIERRKAARVAARLEAAKSLTFRRCAEDYIASHRKGWRTEKQAVLWTSTLASYVEPVFGDLPVQFIDTGLVMRVLSPIWGQKPETASRVRGRIESILDWARVHGYRSGENPARWRGHLDKLLPKQSKVAPVKHHAALPYDEIGAFMEALRAQEGIAARALEFAILTATRTGEVIGARWNEIDLIKAEWIAPAERTKTAKPHRVPLSPPVLSIIAKLPQVEDNPHVFFGAKRGKSISNMSMLMTLRRMGRSDVTVHGFRSSFRDWAAEATTSPNEVAEMALGHIVANKVEAAYRRGDLFEKRRQLMDEWARYCTTPALGNNVVPLSRTRAETEA